VRIEKEGQLRRKFIHVHTGFFRCIYISNGIGKRKSNLLRCCGACFTNVISRYADRIPIWDFSLAIAHGICYQPHAGRGWENISSTRDILFQNIILDGTTQFSGSHALLFRDGDVRGKQNRGRRVDGHAGGNPIQWDVFKQSLHIFNGRNGNPYLPYFTQGNRVVRVVSNLGRQVESD